MREIPIFIASSVREFRQGRLELSPFLEMLNNVYKRMDAQLVWNRPETSSRVMNDGGSQLVFDDFIRKSEFFALIVGKSVGTYTRHEYEIALEQFRKTGKPKILPCFLADTSSEAQAFRAELQNAPIGAQFIDPYDNFDAVKNQLQFEIANYVVETAPQSDAEADFQRARERILDKIRGLQVEIKRLENAPASPEIIAEITLTYAEIWRLVREYKVKPDALLDYIHFLWKQHQYSKGIEIGQWLKGFYTMENPNIVAWALLNHWIAQCYRKLYQLATAEQYYLIALKNWLFLEDEHPAVFTSSMADTCDCLGSLLKAMNRIVEAERYYRMALNIWRPLAKVNPATYDSYVARVCNNLGNLLDETNRRTAAEKYYREAFNIYKRLAKTNPHTFMPDVAMICENLGILLENTNRMEEAERYYRESLKIRQRLAEKNPDAFQLYLAIICNNLAILLRKTNQTEEAKQYYREALEIFKRLAENNTSFQVFGRTYPPQKARYSGKNESGSDFLPLWEAPLKASKI